MLRFNLLGFPITIHWYFWLTMALLGGISQATNTPDGMQRLLVWILAGFLSILIHELGHALTMRHYGARRVEIVLQSFGGYAMPDRGFGRSESFYVTAAGPFFQIAAGVVMWWIMDAVQTQNMLGLHFMKSFMRVSFFWAILNLFPIIPLDGGRIMQALLGPRREKMVLTISIVCAVGFGIWALTRGQFFMVVFFGFFALNNWKQLQGEPPATMP